MKKVHVGHDIVGEYTARPVYGTSNPLPLIQEGVRIEGAMIEALLRRGIGSVWIVDELFPDLHVQEVVRYETQQFVKAALTDMFEPTGGMSEEVLNGRAVRLVQTARSLVQEIVTNDDIVANISHLRTWDNYTFEHSVHVAMFSVIVGKRMKMEDERLLRLGTGALLHDIGKIGVPQEILKKPDRLSTDEFDLIKSHPRMGWDHVHRYLPWVMPTSAVIVLQHHERLDGSGYPSGLKGDDIYVFSKIVAAADVYDALRSERTYRTPYTPGRILEIMRQEAGSKLDREAVDTLLERVALVPVGDIVRLSDGRVGVVTRLNPGAPLKPVVAVVTDTGGASVEPMNVDLLSESAFVDRILDDWPEGLRDKVRSRNGSGPLEHDSSA